MSSRKVPEINSGSMADIAFLLLVFFLMVTTIDQDKGLMRKLPPMPDENNPPQDVQTLGRNVLFVWVNSNDALLVKGEYAEIKSLKRTAKAFIDNNGRDPRYSVSPQKAIISIKNDIGTSYDMYLQVQNEIMAAYNELRDDYSMRKFRVPYKELNDKEKRTEVKKAYPLRVSEAEPAKIGES